MSYAVTESRCLGIGVVVMFLQPIAEIIAGFELERQRKMKIMIRLVERRAARRSQINVLVLPLELRIALRWSRILREESYRLQNRAFAAPVRADQNSQRTQVEADPLPKSLKVLCLQLR